MKILMTGGTGFIGRAVVARLLGSGHSVRVWTRSPERARSRLGADVEIVEASERFDGAIAGCDAVINLAGEGIADARWTEARKRELRDSRVGLTQRLVEAIGRAEHKPHSLVSASAVGIYPDGGPERINEESGRGEGFLAELCADWEDAARAASDHGVRVAVLRIGVVLGREGGALAKMTPPFRMGVGGRLGSGQQYMPWIHLVDLVELVVRAVEDDRMTGPFNATAPEPVTNAELTAELGRVLSRPAVMAVPRIALRTLLGEASEILLASQRVLPARAIDHGFDFRFPSIAHALNDLLGDPSDVVLRPIDGNPDSDYLERRPPRHVLEVATAIEAPREEVFEFFSKPSNLGLMTPPSLAFDMLTPDVVIEEGATLDYQIKIGPVPMMWRTKIVGWSPRLRFVDAQERGPYACWWHEHVFEARGRETIMRDRVFYRVPFGLVGRAVNRLFVAPMLKRIFAYRSSVTALRFRGPMDRSSSEAA